MRSKQLLIPGESKTELDMLKSRLFETIDPQDPVEEMLTTRVFEREWYRRRGIRATTDRTSNAIEAILDGVDAREAQEVDRLAPLVETGDRDALRQLRSFPAGVAYLRTQWTILQSRLFEDRNLLGSQRLRCFRLAGTDPLHTLRDDPVATKVLRIQIGVMLGPDADPVDVASFLGEQPPEWMDQDEYDIRVTQMCDSLKPKKESFLELMDYVAEVIAELQAHELKIQEVAARRLEQEAGGAAVDSSPGGIRLMTYITNNEKGCDAALRRIELGRKPDRPGSKRAPKKSEAAPVAAAPKPESSREPAAFATDVQGLFAAEVPAGDAATPRMTQATEIEQDDVPGPLTGETSADFWTVEAVEEPAQAEAGAGFSALEAILDEMGDGAELEIDSPQFVRLREVCRQIEATFCAGRRSGDDPEQGTHPAHGRTDTPLARAEERFRRRQEELSRQIDAHYGINGERPEPVGKDPIPDGAGRSDRPEWGDSS